MDVSLILRREPKAIGYALGNFGKNLLWSAADLTLMFVLTDILNLPPGWSGTVMGLALLGDMVVDLAGGRITAAMQRRRIGYAQMLAWGAPACGIAFAVLCALIAARNPRIEAVAGALLLFRTCYGLVDIPHNAMLSGMAADDRGRGRIAGYRYFFSSAAALMIVMWMVPRITASTEAGAGLPVFGWSAATVFVLTLWLAAAAYRHRAVAVPVVTSPGRFLPPIRARYGRLLVLALLAGGASAMFTRSMIYYCSYYIGDAAAAGRILSTVIAGQLAGAALWSLATQRFDTAKVLAAANAVSAALIAVFPLLESDWRSAGGFAAGVALAGVFALPWALLADVIDGDHRRSGVRHETQAVALFVTCLKGGAAMGMIVAGWALASAGYGAASWDAPGTVDAVLGLTIVAPVVGGMLATLVAVSMIERSLIERNPVGVPVLSARVIEPMSSPKAL